MFASVLRSLDIWLIGSKATPAPIREAIGAVWSDGLLSQTMSSHHGDAEDEDRVHSKLLNQRHLKYFRAVARR